MGRLLYKRVISETKVSSLIHESFKTNKTNINYFISLLVLIIFICARNTNNSLLIISTLLLSSATSSKGSIVAEFQLMFRKFVAIDEAIADLRQEISDGKLGSLSVDPESLERIPDATRGISPG